MKKAKPSQNMRFERANAGIFRTVGGLKQKGKVLASYCFYRFSKSFSFTFRGAKYPYFYHTYNHAWRSERTVEVPIVWNMVKLCSPKGILEVGNVLSHYYPVHHDIVDKYERVEGVINEDIVDFNPEKKYDLIVSISTLEHVGWDEKPRQPRKFIEAINNMKKLLNPGGKMIITYPLGYNHEMDGFKFDECYFMKRISKRNVWIEVSRDTVYGAGYGTPYSYGNVIAVVLIRQH